MGGHFTFLSLSSSQCFKHCNTVSERWLDWSCCVFVWVKKPPHPLPTTTPSFPGSVALSHKHTCRAVCAPSWPRPTVSQLTVKFWFSRAGRSRHPSSLSDARQDSKKRQTRPPHKQLEDSFFWSGLQTWTPTFGTQKKEPFKTPSSAVFSTAVAAPILCRIALFHFTATAHRSSVCRALAQVWGPRVLLSLAQRG